MSVLRIKCEVFCALPDWVHYAMARVIQDLCSYGNGSAMFDQSIIISLIRSWNFKFIFGFYAMLHDLPPPYACSLLVAA